MKNIFILLIILFSTQHLNAQATWNTKLAFLLRDENAKPINLDRFKESYILINVYGDAVPNEKLSQYLTYDEKSNYFILDIETIGPRFSFALSHNNELMVIYLPFVNPTNTYYAVAFDFKKGKFLFDFDIKNRERIYFESNMPHYIVKRINWKKQRAELNRSAYSTDKTYDKYEN